MIPLSLTDPHSQPFKLYACVMRRASSETHLGALLHLLFGYVAKRQHYYLCATIQITNATKVNTPSTCAVVQTVSTITSVIYFLLSIYQLDALAKLEGVVRPFIWLAPFGVENISASVMP